MALPMPKPTVAPLSLPEYKVISFDVYGTLIEYKAQILASFQPLLSRLQSPSPYLDPTPSSSSIPGAASVGSIEFLKLFQRHEDAIKLEKPVRRFDVLLAEIWRRMAQDLGVPSSEDEAAAFGSSATVASWPTFPGTVDALRQLSNRYKLVALSNIDRFAWSITADPAASRGPLGDVVWWKVFTAEDFGEDVATRADDAKLECLMDYATEAGIQKDEILHVAQSLGHDQAPAKRLGLSSVWLVGDGPRWGKEGESRMALEKELVGYAWRFADLKEFEQEVEKAFDHQ